MAIYTSSDFRRDLVTYQDTQLSGSHGGDLSKSEMTPNLKKFIEQIKQCMDDSKATISLVSSSSSSIGEVSSDSSTNSSLSGLASSVLSQSSDSDGSSAPPESPSASVPSPLPALSPPGSPSSSSSSQAASSSSSKPPGPSVSSEEPEYYHGYNDDEKDILEDFLVTLEDFGLDGKTINKYVKFVKDQKLTEPQRFQKSGVDNPTGFDHTITGTPGQLLVHLKDKIGEGAFKKVSNMVTFSLDNPKMYKFDVDYTFKTTTDRGKPISLRNITDEIESARQLKHLGFEYVTIRADHFIMYISPKNKQVRCFARTDRCGPDLEKMLNAGVSTFTLLKVLADAAKGLKELHDHGLSHRDIKMDNILSKRKIVDGKVMLGGTVGDIGFVTNTPEKSIAGVGNAGHKPPEFFEAKSKGINAGQFQNRKGEVWALGMMIYLTMIAKNSNDFPKFVSDMARKEKIPSQEQITDFIDSIKEYDPWDKGVKAILERCLRRNPDERPDFDVVAKELDALAEKVRKPIESKST